MQRLTLTARRNWQTTLESQGFVLNPDGGQPIWDETVCYRLTPKQIDEIERATYELDRMCQAAADHVVRNHLLKDFGIPAAFEQYIARSWQNDEPTLIGRFDLVWDGIEEPRLAAYHADSPTSLLEAALLQRQWMQDVFPNADQFNSIHDRLVEAWKLLTADMSDPVHFVSPAGNLEGRVTLNYVRATAIEAGRQTRFCELQRIGWDAAAGRFIDETACPIGVCVKIHPWQRMIHETFGEELLADTTAWLEPPWKAIVSNRAILPVLRELFPNSPYLRAQPRATAPSVAGFYPLIGSWMINGYACGIGIREDVTPVPGSQSRFVPHIFMG